MEWSNTIPQCGWGRLLGRPCLENVEFSWKAVCSTYYVGSDSREAAQPSYFILWHPWVVPWTQRSQIKCCTEYMGVWHREVLLSVCLPPQHALQNWRSLMFDDCQVTSNLTKDFNISFWCSSFPRALTRTYYCFLGIIFQNIGKCSEYALIKELVQRTFPCEINWIFCLPFGRWKTEATGGEWQWAHPVHGQGLAHFVVSTFILLIVKPEMTWSSWIFSLFCKWKNSWE